MIARLVQGFIAFGLAYTVALWIALVLWTWRDIAARSSSPFVQVFSTLIVLLFFAPGAVIYLMLRPRETLDEAYQRSVAEEYLVQDLEEFPACPACRRPVRDDFAYCPHCRLELRRTCPDCGRLADLSWEICAYCGRTGHGRISVPSVFDRASWDGVTPYADSVEGSAGSGQLISRAGNVAPTNGTTATVPATAHAGAQAADHATMERTSGVTSDE
ncbi:MAG: zinc ribbon domain-containing protein [Chloroflexi bacterium]|nr:MAG: zinc ribbon domain-containing protein [Chloroflexota bacterium]